MTITPLAAKETPNSAASNISASANVYICNTLTSASGLVTLQTSAGVAIATFDVPASGQITLKKKNAEKVLTSAATITCTAIGFGN
jgi:hypothetical protein|tara:strand:- start:400 stop:657 length:258 start_codon:yes stop_codon:yes gene_type:complete